MRYLETVVNGAYLVIPEPRHDARGFFVRIFCADEFAERGMDPSIAQSSIAHNVTRGTLRGLHFQRAPRGENKLVRCLRGRLYLVAADLRPRSPSYLTHVGVVLAAEDRRALYIPMGCATGYQTLEDDTEIMYDISTAHAPGYEGGVHHQDPTLAIQWPLPVVSISDRDAALPHLEHVRVA